MRQAAADTLERRNMKKETKLFSIGEVAKSLGITRRIILNYEEKGLINYDVKNGEQGNRYYTMDTYTKIHTVRLLQKLGLSLDEIRSYLEGTVDLISLIKRLEAMRDELSRNIEKLYERVKTENEQIKEIYIEQQTVYRRTATAKTIAQKSEMLRLAALEATQTYGTDLTKRMYFIEYPLNQPEEISCCITVPAQSKGKHIIKLSGCRALCIYHHGAYEGLPAADQKLLEYATANGFTPLGSCRHIYLEGPPQHKDKNLFITQAVLPVE